MYEQLRQINRHPQPFERYTAEVLWTDPHLAGQMLRFHLNPETEWASRNPAFIDRSVDWIVERFAVGRKTRIADFGCGPGLYANRLAARGADVTGIDFSAGSIAFARRWAEQYYLQVDYIEQNYLEFETDRKFDLILMIYCDFCALSPQQRRVLLEKFRSCLAAGGAVLLDVFSLAALDCRQEAAVYEHRLQDGLWSPGDYYGFLTGFKYDEEKVFLDKYTIVEPDRTWEVFNWLQYYSVESLREEFRRAGLSVEEIYSDVTGEPYEEGSEIIAVVAGRA